MYAYLQQDLRFWHSETGETGETGATEVVSKTVARTPLPTHAGGQDDGSYTNSLKLKCALVRAQNNAPVGMLDLGGLWPCPITTVVTKGSQ